MEPADETQFLESSLLLFCNFILGIIFFSGIAANLLVLLVFYRKPGLRTTANRFVINLMVINIVTCGSLLPVTLTDNSAVPAVNYLCFAEQFISIFCSSVIVYSVLLIAVDQYFAVVDPLHYHCIISSCKGYLMIVSIWAFSAALAFFGAIQPDLGIFQNSIFRQCGIRFEKFTPFENDSSENSVKTEITTENFPGLYQIVFCISFVTAAFLIPFTFICFIYYKICAAASGNSKRTRTSILTNDDSSQILREKFQGEANESEKAIFHQETTSFMEDKNQSKMGGEQMESSRLLPPEAHECSPKPSLVVTRPSPPRTSPFAATKCDFECEFAGKDGCDAKLAKNEEISAKVKAEAEVPFLKPTLKNNTSFTKLSSLHIQFSNSTEKINDGKSNPTERRHSNVPLTVVDPEFESISKGRSPSVQSNFYEIPSRSSSSTRSTTTSTQIKSSRSSSLNSTCTRHPPSRASSIRSTSSYIVHNIRHRISNASLFRYREEARAARISAMVIVMALFCWLPFFTIFSLHSGISFGRYPNFSHYFDAFSLVFLLLSTVVSPFLFAFRNRHVKKEIRRIFQFWPENLSRDCTKSFYKHNFSLSLKSQTVQLFTELNKSSSAKQGENSS